jgi:hypothetical protein
LHAVSGTLQHERRFHRLDFNIAKNNWHINISRAQESNGSDTAVQIGYVLALSRSRNSTGNCSHRPDSAPSFEPLIDAAIKRPHQFPREPLAKADTSPMDPIAEQNQ